jgi:hypothetical protein
MSIKFYGKSEDVCQMMIDTFRAGNLPEALKPIFVNRSDNIPSTAWSWSNRFMMAIAGTADARGFRQWQNAGRKVKKGARAFHILGPCIAKRKDAETGEEKTFLYGFKSIPVFAIESTEVFDPEKWEQAGGIDTNEEKRLESIPLFNVAKAWGLNVTSYNGKGGGALGYYSHGGTIALGVENLATWCHELTHAADDKNGTITKKPGQQPDNEIVAEVGGAVLLSLMGYHHEADLGGAWDYVKHYAGGDTQKTIRKIMQLIDRICSCVDLIIKTAESEEIKAAHAA